jgi:1,4-alpha-glucan branching enzyme
VARWGKYQPPPPRSAEVSQDGRVTFRLSAPKAAEVVVNGNWENGRGIAMTKDASGIWTVTTGPLAPELWTYTFFVDGVSMLDPGGHEWKVWRNSLADLAPMMFR